ncbi:PREDICTED: midnolin-like [Ceratosolen solmsi marchali]|uniref:Midnolin-like n=1 Tax=Ceratosolen solmsi marchali TaxID=326594 RepID=A0AAJ6YCP4_9HYME|nr:PREDICTED: midnolin-like [Ceratosolen solmsi marchali]
MAAATATATPTTATATTPDSAAKCSFILGQCYCSKSPKKKSCTGTEVGAPIPKSIATHTSPCTEACAAAAAAAATATATATAAAAVAAAATTTTATTIATPPLTPTSLESSPEIPTTDPTSNPTATLDTRALVEASRNLTQKLKQLSSEENAKRRQGAIIESMHHHGKGVYTGTFSGTLNPALQDRHGRPKRDISTIIHILNDLLCATPATSAGHYRNHRHPGAHRGTAGASVTGAQVAAANQPSSMFAANSASPASVMGATGLETAVACHDVPNTSYSSEELSKENEATKGKMRRLRLVMEQRREKLRARRKSIVMNPNGILGVFPDYIGLGLNVQSIKKLAL